MIGPLLAASIVQLLAAGTFAFVAATFRGRSHSAGVEAGAASAFSTWWASMSAYMLVQAGLGLLAAAGYASVALYVAARFALVPILCAAAWGISYYVGFLFTGRAWLRVALGVYFALVGLAFTFVYVEAPAPVLHVTPFSAGLGDPPGIAVIYAAFAIPLLTADIAFLTLAFRLDEPIKRYRVALSGGAILAWVATGLVTNLGRDPVQRFVGVTLLGLATALAVVLAYRPPRFVRLRLDPRPVDREIVTARKTAMRERLLELV